MATKAKAPPLPRKKWSKDDLREEAAKAKISNVKSEEDLIFRYRYDFEGFVDEMIIAPYNLETGKSYVQSEQQREGARAIQQLCHEKALGINRDILGVSIMSGKGTGKDAFTSWAIMWFMTCFSYPKIPCTSVSADQLSKVLWSEISKWLMFSPLKAHLKLQADLLYCSSVPKEALKKRWFAFPKAANPKNSPDEQLENLQGIHEEHVLQVVDEGSGVLHPVFKALEENMTGAINLMLLIFNPTRARCYAVDTQYGESDRWICLRWNAEESELVEPAVIQAALSKYGRESNTYRIKILGLPPITDDQTLIPWDWIMDAVDRDVEPLQYDPIVKGVDCGAGGDNSIICTRKGPQVYPIKRKKTPDSNVLENWIGADIDEENPDVVRIDTIGIGWGIEGNVRHKKGSVVEGADVRRNADEPERFKNKRAEMYWRLREAFEHSAISIPDDEELKDQLGAMKVIYGKVIQIEDKRKIKKELGHSPDEADALALTYFFEDSMVSRNTRPRNGRDDAPVGGGWQAA
jgi:hypothetical protein|tara:strand:- start:19 stop:1578 length:1560 start_codon:yes stop_codon:yes gene_type:complete